MRGEPQEGLIESVSISHIGVARRDAKRRFPSGMTTKSGAMRNADSLRNDNKKRECKSETQIPFGNDNKNVEGILYTV